MSKADYEIKVLRESTVLTNSFVPTAVRGNNDNLDLTGKNQVVLLLDFTIGALTSLEMKVEFSHDNVDFYQETSLEIVGGIGIVNLYEYTFNATGKYRISFPIKDKYMRISVSGTGTVTSSLLKITSITGLS